MKFAIVSRNPETLRKHKATIKKYLNYISTNPDVVIAVGGDGAYLASERFFPNQSLAAD